MHIHPTHDQAGRPSVAAHRSVRLFAAAFAACASAFAQAPIDFRTPDGTRFLLLSRPGAPIVHWSVATPAGAHVESARAHGLSEAVLRASLRGTWSTGSLDVAKEKQAREELDALESTLAEAKTASPETARANMAKAEGLREALGKLCDPAAFRRVFAGAPAAGMQLDIRGDVATLSMTTTPLGISNVARLLLERREQPALRGFESELDAIQARDAAAWDQDPLAPLYAEALALAFPGHPLAQSGGRPNREPVRRSDALDAWARTQNPRHTVHALVGNFDVAAARVQLERTFAATTLPSADPAPRAEARAQNAIRRATIPGARKPAALIAFALPRAADPHSIETVARWFADGADSWLGRELARAGRSSARIAVRAPWPSSASPGLLVIEATDAAGTPQDLADDVLGLLANSHSASPEPGRLPVRFAALQRSFLQRTDTPLHLAAAIAAYGVQDPSESILSSPATPIYAELTRQLQAILATSPIVVEWRDS